MFFVKKSRKTFLIFVTSAVLRHAVAHADFRKNVPGFVGIRLELAADAGHVHPEDLVVRTRGGTPPVSYYSMKAPRRAEGSSFRTGGLFFGCSVSDPAAFLPSTAF